VGAALEPWVLLAVDDGDDVSVEEGLPVSLCREGTAGNVDKWLMRSWADAGQAPWVRAAAASRGQRRSAATSPRREGSNPIVRLTAPPGAASLLHTHRRHA
jgi:hypothetical protein